MTPAVAVLLQLLAALACAATAASLFERYRGVDPLAVVAAGVFALAGVAWTVGAVISAVGPA